MYLFAINKYSDGTWPFKTSFASEIEKLTPFSEVMYGYYISESEAASMRQGMMETFQQSGGTIKQVVYKNKKVVSSSTGDTTSDF